MLTEFFKNIEEKRNKTLQRLVRREFYANIRDVEQVIGNPSIRGHDVLPDLVDACRIMRDHGMAPADAAAARRVGALARAAMAKMPSWYGVGDDAWDTLCAVDPSLALVRVEHGQYVENKSNKITAPVPAVPA